MHQATGRIGRVLRVTGILAVVGGLVGAVCAAIISFVLLSVKSGELEWAAIPSVYVWLPARVGFVLGAVIAPLVAWGLLRHISFGRVLAVGTPATVVGALLGEQWRSFNPYGGVPGVLIGAVGGFLVAGVVLRIAHAWSVRNQSRAAAS